MFLKKFDQSAIYWENRIYSTKWGRNMDFGVCDLVVGVVLGSFKISILIDI